MANTYNGLSGILHTNRKIAYGIIRLKAKLEKPPTAVFFQCPNKRSRCGGGDLHHNVSGDLKTLGFSRWVSGWKWRGQHDWTIWSRKFRYLQPRRPWLVGSQVDPNPKVWRERGGEGSVGRHRTGAAWSGFSYKLPWPSKAMRDKTGARKSHHLLSASKWKQGQIREHRWKLPEVCERHSEDSRGRSAHASPVQCQRLNNWSIQLIVIHWILFFVPRPGDIKSLCLPCMCTFIFSIHLAFILL